MMSPIIIVFSITQQRLTYTAGASMYETGLAF